MLQGGCNIWRFLCTVDHDSYRVRNPTADTGSPSQAEKDVYLRAEALAQYLEAVDVRLNEHLL